LQKALTNIAVHDGCAASFMQDTAWAVSSRVCLGVRFSERQLNHSRGMAAPIDLHQLLAHVALRDRAALRRLYDAVSPSLFGVAMRIVNRRDRAEEVLQDAFINIWNKAAGYNSATSQPMTWMTAIVRNRALDELRREKRNVAQSLDDGKNGSASDVEDNRPNPLELLEQAADSLRIRGCLDAIDGPQRQCLALAYYHGLSHSELAQHLGSPIGSVKVWLRRGLQKMKRCLERHP
jgi:RNA polymerase sigma-70 factor, ECF subfamily